MPKTRRYLRGVYKKLYTHFGPQHWWPADSPLEVVIGAILTQNAAWGNVEKAIAQLKKRKILASPRRLYRTAPATLSRLIRPCGYYNVKARRLRNFLQVLFAEFKGSLPLMFSLKSAALRKRLLAINGIGPETADSIILYAARRPIFVVDAYTRRFLFRHGLVESQDGYQQIQSLFEENLPRRLDLFGEYHALLVRLGKDFCRPRPRCNMCPLHNN